MKMRQLAPLVLALSLAGCATGQAPASPAPPHVMQEMAEAAITPLNDLNIARTEIPPLLIAARKRPYQPPGDATCPGLFAEIEALDDVLGNDLDAPKPKDPTLLQRGARAAENAAVGVVRGSAEAVVPFRGWVRKLTGAERSSKEVSAAISAGGFRRAFLKGMALGAGCTAPVTEL